MYRSQKVTVNLFCSFKAEPTAVCLPYITWTAWLHFIITLVPIPNLSYWQPITLPLYQSILLLYYLTHVCALNLLDELSIVI